MNFNEKLERAIKVPATFGDLRSYVQRLPGEKERIDGLVLGRVLGCYPDHFIEYIRGSLRHIEFDRPYPLNALEVYDWICAGFGQDLLNEMRRIWPDRDDVWFRYDMATFAGLLVWGWVTNLFEVQGLVLSTRFLCMCRDMIETYDPTVLPPGKNYFYMVDLWEETVGHEAWINHRGPGRGQFHPGFLWQRVYLR